LKTIFRYYKINAKIVTKVIRIIEGKTHENINSLTPINFSCSNLRLNVILS